MHEWRVLTDAAERFPTTGNASSSSDEDDDDGHDETYKISESTWAALFALERENKATDRGQHLKNNDENNDDDESSLDGGLGQLAPCHGTVSTANQLQLSASSMLSSEDSDPSLQFTMPSPRFTSNNRNHPATASATPYAGFHDGFRMNSDQSLGMHSTASSSNDRSLNLAAPLRSSFISGRSKNSGNFASTIPFTGFNDGFRMNSDQSLGIHSIASSSSGRSFQLVAPPRSSPTTTTSNHAGIIPFADFHEGFRMNSDQSLGVRSVASSSSANSNSIHNRDSATMDDQRRVSSMPTIMAISTTSASTKYSECNYPKQQGLRNLMASLRDEEIVEATRVASAFPAGTATRHG